MTRILLLILGLIISGTANAQFATGYGPSSGSGAPVMEAPKPVIPQIPTPYRGSIKILAMVNGDIITTEDINHRVRAFSMSTGIPYNEQTRVLIINKVMQNTIDEKLKLQEAKRNQIEISEKEIDASVQNFVRSNNSTLPELKKMLKQAGVNEDVFREQMKTDLAWIRLIRRKIAAEPVTQLEIEEAIRLAKNDISKPKYMVSEIVISKEDAKHMDELVGTLRKDPRFELYAAQFSESPSSSSGGQLGWISEGQLPEPLDNAIKKVSEGGITNAILYNDNYHILKVEKKFTPKEGEKFEPNEAEIKSMLEGQKSERVAAQLLQSLRQKAAIELKE